MTKTQKLSLNLSVTLGAKPNEVFKALTDSKAITQWCGQNGKVESKPGGKFEMFDGWVKGKVIKFRPGKSLAYSWTPEDWPSDAKASVVEYTLNATKTGTKITLKHSGFPNQKEMKNHKSGWTDYVFDPLKQYLSET